MKSSIRKRRAQPRPQRSLSNRTADWHQGPGIHIALILVAGLCAHVGCLDSTFFLDDWWQILNSDHVEGGRWFEPRTQALTQLSYHVTWRLSGFSEFWFHLFNLALHLVTALSLYALGPALLRTSVGDRLEERMVAWLAAILFVVHPLTTEITNYARARDHGLVGLFTLLTAGFCAMGMTRRWVWFLLAAGSVLLASISKGPGLPQSLLAGGIVVLAHFRKEQLQLVFRNRWPVYGTLAALCCVWLLTWRHVADLGWTLIQGTLSNDRFGWHLLTQARVFWSYVGLLLWPQGLSADHLFAWTRSVEDVEAWIALFGVSALIGLITFLWVRAKQPWAMLGALAVSALLLRWLYLSELMVEYRTYPALPYVALLASMGIIAWHARAPRLATSCAFLLVLAYACISFLRSEEWSSLERLHISILKKDPLQLRAFNGLSTADEREGNWKAILNRYPEFKRRLQQVFRLHEENPARYYGNWPLWAVMEECMVSEALLEKQGVDAAQSFHRDLWKRMQTNGFDREPLLRGQWNLVAAKIELRAGNTSEARKHLREAVKTSVERRKARQMLEELESKPACEDPR